MQLSRQASEQVNNVDIDVNINVEKQEQQQQSEIKESNSKDEQRSDTPKSAETAAASRTSSPTTSGPDSQISDNVNQGFDRVETGQLNFEEKQSQQFELGNVNNDTNVDESNVTNIEVEPQHTTESVESVEPSKPNQSVQPEDGQSDQRKEPNQSVAEVQLSDGGSESVKAAVAEPVVEVDGKRVEFGDAVDDKSVCKDDASESKVWVL